MALNVDGINFVLIIHHYARKTQWDMVGTRLFEKSLGKRKIMGMGTGYIRLNWIPMTGRDLLSGGNELVVLEC